MKRFPFLNMLIAAGTAFSLTVLCSTFLGAVVFSQAADIDGSPQVTIAEHLPFSEEGLSADPIDPTRLKIPVLHIDAAVQKVGVTPKGNMGIPTNFTDVAWYKDGVRPGEGGSAVFSGHLDNGVGLPGVFNRLDHLRVGDYVDIEGIDGRSLRFQVFEIAEYSYQDAPIERIFGMDGGSRLALVTCIGDWIPSLKTYDQRLIVYATLTDVR